jgi:hypothetical protein
MGGGKLINCGINRGAITQESEYSERELTPNVRMANAGNGVFNDREGEYCSGPFLIRVDSTVGNGARRCENSYLRVPLPRELSAE